MHLPSILFILPSALTVFTDNKWIGLGLCVLIGCGVYGILLISAWGKKIRNEETDSITIYEIKNLQKNLQKKIVQPETKEKSGDNIKNPEEELIAKFKSLSCSGQMKMLHLVQSKDLKLRTDQIKKLAANAHTPQILEVITDICSMSSS